jgi:predicted RNA methylase
MCYLFLLYQYDRTLVDLGSGLGKLAMQAFLSYPNLSRVIAVEFAPSRAEKGV